LKEKDGAWRQRRIEECDKIREEDKRDRLAVAREKKKRYGINTISKDENLKIKKRTEERLDIAKAKENLWKRFRDRKDDKEMEDEELKAWETLKKSVVELEEGGGEWKTAGRDIRNLILSEKLVIKARREDTPEVEQFCINTGEEIVMKVREKPADVESKHVEEKSVKGEPEHKLKSRKMMDKSVYVSRAIKEKSELEIVRAKILAKKDEEKRKDRPGLSDETLPRGREEEGGEQHREQHPQVVGGGAVLFLKERIKIKQKENASIFIKNINKYKQDRRLEDLEMEEGRRSTAGAVVEGQLGSSSPHKRLKLSSKPPPIALSKIWPRIVRSSSPGQPSTSPARSRTSACARPGRRGMPTAFAVPPPTVLQPSLMPTTST
jgi:hypothetical protein